jgi:rSAM/selenodomain-associated transferase 1
MNHLIIFTRYPEPGKTKTRLIPALGALGAANLQRQMTEHTILQATELQKSPALSPANLTVEVRFSGGNEQLMQNWLGIGLIYQPQGGGNLGDRMHESFVDAFTIGTKQVILIGSDCPGISSQILTTAFEQLQNADLVLGPAIDGGYYLIGLQQPIPELFVNINWGTGQVCQQTVDIAQKLNLLLTYLPPLVDIDRPEDLSMI